MKLPALLCSAVLLVPALAPRQEEKPKKKDKDDVSVTRFFQEEAERKSKEIQGSWALLDYSDPAQPPQSGAASGFATFHDGLVTMFISVDTYESRMFRAHEFTMVNASAYRYRFEGPDTLQLASVMGITNQTPDGDVDHEPSNRVYEYSATLKEGSLELRNTDSVTLTFRRVTMKEFPESALRKLESQRSGTPHWERDEGDGDKPH